LNNEARATILAPETPGLWYFETEAGMHSNNGGMDVDNMVAETEYSYILRSYTKNLRVKNKLMEFYEAQPFKAYWIRDAPTGLIFKNCTFCPHCIFVFCI